MTLTNEQTLIHQALTYDTVEDYLAEMVPFVRAGLAAGEPTYVINTPRKLGTLANALGPADAAATEFVASHTWHTTPGAAMAACRQFVESMPPDGPRVRIGGEPFWTKRTDAEAQEWAHYEAALNVALAAAPVWVLCTYDTRLTPPHALADAIRTHPELAGDTPNRHRSARYVSPEQFTANGAETVSPAPSDAARLEFDGHGLAAVRRWVSGHGHAAGLDNGQVRDLVLSVHEVAANAVLHGAGGGAIQAWTEPSELICQVSDAGLLDSRIVGYVPPAAADPESGRGLWLARQLSDLVEVRRVPEGTVVRIHINR